MTYIPNDRAHTSRCLAAAMVDVILVSLRDDLVGPDEFLRDMHGDLANQALALLEELPPRCLCERDPKVEVTFTL